MGVDGNQVTAINADNADNNDTIGMNEGEQHPPRFNGNGYL